jgi:hypothetical protein
MMEGFNIDTIRNQSHDVSMPPTPQVVPQHAPIAYITQHYTHSAHVAPQQYSETSVSDALAAAGVNASALLPSQIQLFRHAQPDQQARLIELWRIAPPTYGNQLLAKHLGNWPSTSFEREEEAARAHWDAEQEKIKNLCVPQVLAEPYIVNGYQNLAYVNEVNSPTQHTERDQDKHVAECGGKMEREWWQMENQPMEHQYGMLQQMTMQGLQLDSHDEEML